MATILIVDDDQAVLTLVSRLLKDSGFDIATAPGPEAALQLVKTECLFDLLLTDLQMPEMNGIKLAKAILEHRPGVPVLYMSGYADDSVIAATGGALLQKPFSRTTLVARVNEMLGRSPG